MKNFFLIFFLLFIGIPHKAFALDSFVSVVNPIRGADFWTLADQKPETAVIDQVKILRQYNFPATWLIRFDAFDNKNIIDTLKNNPSDEKGLFLEVTPSWATRAKVDYHKSGSWHAAGSAFLTGYEPAEREKLIDAGFEKFKTVFGVYPSSVGAWWIDSFSLDYMKKKFGIVTALIVADQYSTDNYQIWGQYFGTPYYPSKNNALHPAQTLDNKLDIVMTQWASRDPVNSYGNGVAESTFSLQANDYMDYHNLDTGYFSKLIDIYTKQKFNLFSHLVVGLENSYEWNKYSNEYGKQIEVLAQKSNSREFSILTLGDFGKWYQARFPKLSPSQIIIADDLLGSFKKSVWFMNPYYRAGWFFNEEGSLFRDIRQYIDGEEELCLKARCNSVNFATSAIRVLDEVSFGQKWQIDKGKITDFNVIKNGENYILSYKNEAGNIREISLLPRDIGIDGKILSIDAAILDATKKGSEITKVAPITESDIKWSLLSVVGKTFTFLVFLVFAVIVPGLLLTRKILGKETAVSLRLFISATVGFVALALIFYIAGVTNFKLLTLLYILLCLILFIRSFSISAFLKLFPQSLHSIKLKRLSIVLLLIISLGTIFQVIPTFRSGLNFDYGLGFWGPNTHDGVWHMALINQLMKSVPPENPIYSGSVLKNYHFFYDILIAATGTLSGLATGDLIFRFFPIVFSLMLGVGSYYLLNKLFGGLLSEIQFKVAAIFSLFLIYFAGSFGWIVEFLRERHLGGESAFWVNQAVSFNLNPPYAISLVILISLVLILLFSTIKLKSGIIIVLIAGTLVSFKSYTGFLVLGALIIVSLFRIFRKKDFSYFWITLGSFILSAWLFLSNFQISSALLIFAPFWFIHSMIDSPDRVGWYRLSIARTSSESLGQWPKYILTEIISLILFIAGNLGVRILSFGLIFKIKDIFKNDALLFLFVLLISSIGIPILFIQSGNPWNTIQFFYPALYISALLGGVVISRLFFRIGKIPAAVFIIIILSLGPINSVVTANGYLGKTPHAFVSTKEGEALQFLSKQRSGVVLTYPYDEKLKQRIKEPWPLLAYDSTSYVSAFSKKAVFLEDEPQNQILLTDYKKRLVASKDFFLKPISESRQFLKVNNIKYIYIPKIFNVRLDESSNAIKNIFENDEVVIYSVL